MRSIPLLLFVSQSALTFPIPDPGLLQLNLAIGEKATAEGLFAFAYGKGACASGYCSSAIGNGAKAVGARARASGEQAVAIGEAAIAKGDHTKAIGDASRADGPFSQAIGTGSQADGINAIVIGDGSVAEGINVGLRGDGIHIQGSNFQHIDPEIAKVEGSSSQAGLDHSHNEELDRMEKGISNHHPEASALSKTDPDGEQKDGMIAIFIEEHPECSICLEFVLPSEVLNPGVQTACNHKLHQTCLVNWMLTKLSRPDCPNCRQQPFSKSTFSQMESKLDELV